MRQRVGGLPGSNGSLSHTPAKDVVEARIQLNVIFVNVVIEVLCAQHLGNSHQLRRNRATHGTVLYTPLLPIHPSCGDKPDRSERGCGGHPVSPPRKLKPETGKRQGSPGWAHLVIVVVAMEKRLLAEDHAGQHAAQAPHVQAVVIHLQKKGEPSMGSSRQTRQLTSSCCAPFHPSPPSGLRQAAAPLPLRFYTPAHDSRPPSFFLSGFLMTVTATSPIIWTFRTLCQGCLARDGLHGLARGPQLLSCDPKGPWLSLSPA